MNKESEWNFSVYMCLCIDDHSFFWGGTRVLARNKKWKTEFNSYIKMLKNHKKGSIFSMPPYRHFHYGLHYMCMSSIYFPYYVCGKIKNKSSQMVFSNRFVWIATTDHRFKRNQRNHFKQKFNFFISFSLLLSATKTSTYKIKLHYLFYF